MNEEEQIKRKKIGTIELSDTQELVAFELRSKEFGLSIRDKAEGKELELSIIVDEKIEDKEKDPLFKSAKKRSVFLLSLVVFAITSGVFMIISAGVGRLAPKEWSWSFWWCLVPITILFVGVLVQGLALLPWGQAEHIEKVYKKRKKAGKE